MQAQNFVVGLRLAQRLNAFLLADDHAVVVADVRVGRVAAASGPLAKVVPLQVGAGGQNDVREHATRRRYQQSCITTNSNSGLWYIRTHLLVSRHGAHERAAVAVEHLDLRVALHRVRVVDELLLQRLAAESVAAEFFLAAQNGIGQGEADRAAAWSCSRAQLSLGNRRASHLPARFGIAREPDIAIRPERPWWCPRC